MEGKLLIFSAPSGSGKSTIVQHLNKLELRLAFSISATSRESRKGEVDGREYHFLSPDEFREKIRKKEFVEWEEVYPDQYYGTLRSEVDRIWKTGHHALFDIDVVGFVHVSAQDMKTGSRRAIELVGAGNLTPEQTKGMVTEARAAELEDIYAFG